MWQGFNPNELKLAMMFGLSLLSSLKTTIFPLGLFFVPLVSTVDNLVLKLDRNRRNRLNTYIEKEELSEYEKFKAEEIKKLENVVQVIQDTLKDKINLFEYKENNNRINASFELSKPLSVKDSTFIKSKINN